MVDAFLLPGQERGTLQNIGRGLSAFGEGFQGRGEQFLARDALKEKGLSDERKVRAAKDLERMKRLVDKGDIVGVKNFAEQRINLIRQLGGDPSNTEQFLDITNKALAGDAASVKRLGAELDEGLQDAARGGFIKLPERIKPLSPAGEVAFDIESGILPKDFKTPVKQTALQEKISELQRTGLTEIQAINVASGRHRISRDPVTQVAQIIDVATGQIVGGGPTVGGDIVNLDVGPTPELDFGGQPTSDPTEATGIGGAAKAFSNVVADLFGANLPFDEADKAATELQNINLKSIQLASSGIAGKPNLFFQKKIDELLVKPNEIFTGSGQARNRFEALAKSFRGEADRLQGDLNKGNVTPKTRDALQQRISGLRSLSAEYDTLLQRSGPRQGTKSLEDIFK